MLVEIAYRGVDRADGDDALDYRFDVLNWRDKEFIRAVSLRVTSLKHTQLLHTFGKGDPEKGKPLLFEALIKAGVRRMEQAGVALVEDPDTRLVWPFDGDEIKEAFASAKDCKHQDRRRTDLFCLAAEGSQPARTVTEDRKARTALHSCETICNLPDNRLLCSNFAHVQVVMAGLNPPSPRVGPRVCDAGFNRLIEKDPIACVPGGHDCWRRIVDLRPETKSDPMPALALNEAFDFLSYVWAAKFKMPGKLINLVSSTPAAEIAQSCNTAAEFRTRMNALKDLFDAVKVDASLLTPGVKVGDGSLKRLEHVLQRELPPAEWARAEAGLKVIQDAFDLRNGLHHTDAGKKAAAAAVRFGLNWPPSDWRRAWEQVRDQTARAVREVRQAIEATI